MDPILSIQNDSAIAGIFHAPDAAASLYFMLHSLQHRGSDGAGISSADGKKISTFKKAGMLSESMSVQALEDLHGNLAIGQVRMATPGDLQQENLQPVMVRAHQGDFAIVASGSLTNAPSLRKAMEEEGLIFQGNGDAEIIAHLIQVSNGHLYEKIIKAAQIMKGPCTFLLMTKNTMYAVRSSDGVRSLYMGRIGEGYAFATETAAFGILGATDIREIEPGEMVVLGKDGYRSVQLDLCRKHACAMEAVYHNRLDSLFNGCSVQLLRKEMGKALAKEEDVDADIVVGVPDTAMSAAAGFAQALQKPYELGLIKNRYIGSTFIRPTQQQRDQGLRVRLNAISSIVKGKRIWLVDDSMQKGKTAIRLCQLLREAGAREVHLRIASPAIVDSCIYGTEYIAPKDLAAASYSIDEIREITQADSLRFLSLKDFEALMPQGICLACFNRDYPIDPQDFADLIRQDAKTGK